MNDASIFRGDSLCASAKNGFSAGPRQAHSRHNRDQEAEAREKQSAATVGNDIARDTGTDPENISIKRDPARRALAEPKRWAVREGQVQVNTINVSGNSIAGQRP
jgi:hypothetical protein